MYSSAQRRAAPRLDRPSQHFYDEAPRSSRRRERVLIRYVFWFVARFRLERALGAYRVDSRPPRTCRADPRHPDARRRRCALRPFLLGPPDELDGAEILRASRARARKQRERRQETARERT